MGITTAPRGPCQDRPSRSLCPMAPRGEAPEKLPTPRQHPAAGDDHLLAQNAAGDREALEELFRRYRGVAYRVAYRLLGQEADALDAVQDGFLKAFTHLSAFQGRSSFKTWLLRVVSNSALDLGRQRVGTSRHAASHSGSAGHPAGGSTADIYFACGRRAELPGSGRGLEYIHWHGDESALLCSSKIASFSVAAD